MSHFIIKDSISNLPQLRLGHTHKLFKTRIIIHLFKGERYIHMDFEQYKLLKLLKLHYGIGDYLSVLYIYTSGYNIHSLYKHYPFFLDHKWLSDYYYMINKHLIHMYVFYMRRKLSVTSYWSIRYTNKYPCRGQRTRSNARTAFRLHNYKKLLLDL